MGSEAEQIEQENEVVKDEAVVEAVEPELDEDGIEIDPDESDSDEVEIVREGTQPQFTQQQVNDIVNKRVKRLNGKVTEASDSSAQSNVELDLAREKNKILELALEQAKATKKAEVKLPDPNDFDEGVNDAEYLVQHNNYTQSMIASQVAEQVAKATETVSNTTNQTQRSEALLKKQVKHYERADEIGAKDYEATEDKALEVLGQETANHIIDNFDDSHVIMYFLGKNPDEAKRIAHLLKTQAIKGVAEVGRLSAQLQIKPKNKPIADPDEEIISDGNAQSGTNERKLEKLRDQAAKTGNMKPLMEFKRKHKL